MELKIDAEINKVIDIITEKYPRCHNTFNLKERKRTKNHAIPKFLDPKTIILHSMCLKCHEDLNDCYRMMEVQGQRYRVESNSFTQFLENYEELRKQFYDKKINRGQFGEGLWSNLVSYLKSEAEK